jgi:hypothetical protein
MNFPGRNPNPYFKKLLIAKVAGGVNNVAGGYLSNSFRIKAITGDPFFCKTNALFLFGLIMLEKSSMETV